MTAKPYCGIDGHPNIDHPGCPSPRFPLIARSEEFDAKGHRVGSLLWRLDYGRYLRRRNRELRAVAEARTDAVVRHATRGFRP